MKNNAIAIMWLLTLFICVLIGLLIFPVAYPFIRITGKPLPLMGWYASLVDDIIEEMMEWLLGSDER